MRLGRCFLETLPTFLIRGIRSKQKKGRIAPSPKNRFVILEFPVLLIRRYLILIQITHYLDRSEML